jgi:uncharacterized protein (DUF58 family)
MITNPTTSNTEIRRIQLRTNRLITGDLLGQYRSAFRGTGLIYSELREYQPGDDVKHIHWKATARTGTAFVKSYEEDRQLRILLAVDVSASMRASVGFQPFQKAVEFCSLIGALSQRGNDLLGLLTFANKPLSFLPAKAGARRFSRVLSSLMSDVPQSGETRMDLALEHLALTVRKPSIMFIISDFACADFSDRLGVLAARHDVVLVQLQQSEHSIPNAGVVAFRDAESGQLVAVDTGNPRVREAWKGALLRERESLREIAERAGAAHIVVHERAAPPLVHLMRERVKRVAR